jgi:tetratricopeptide (TPR) repeat protein
MKHLAFFVMILLFVLVGASRGQQTPSPSAPATTSSIPSPANTETDTRTTLRTPRQIEEMHAQISMARKDYLQAAVLYQQILQTDPKDAGILNQIGIAYLQLGDWDHAERFFKKAIRANSSFYNAVNNLGAVEYEKKHYAKAVKYYMQTIKLGSNTAPVYSNLGYAYCEMKQYPQAMDAFGKALAIDPNIFQTKGNGGEILQQRTSENPAALYFTIAKSYAKAGDAEHTAHFLRLARDDGYKKFRLAETDPDFARVIKDARVQEVFRSQPAYATESDKPISN